MLKKTMCCLAMMTMIFVAPNNNNNVSLRLTEQSTDKDVNDNNIYYIESQLEKDYNYRVAVKKEIDRKVYARLKSIQEDKERNKWFDLELTFYTYVECKGGRNAITCNGDKPYQGMVASNVYPQGTILYIEELGHVKVWDRGGDDFHSPNRLDVFIDPLPGENDSAYQQRAYDMGRVYTKGYIVE